MEQLIIYILVLLGLIISFAFSIYIFKRIYAWSIVDRLIASAAPLWVLVFIITILMHILQLPLDNWSNNRLAPAFALAYGYKFFNASDNSPVISWMYGPIAALAYLPATLASSPTLAIMVAGLISLTFFFTPLFLFSIGNANIKNIKQSLFSLGVFVSSFLLVAESPALSYSAFSIHADAPSLGLAGAACAVLYYRKSKDSVLPLLVSSALAILSIWTKQNLLPLPIALLTYVLITDGYRYCLRYALFFLICGALISTIFISFFTFQYLYFTMVKLPTSWPWVGILIPGKYTDSPILTSFQLTKRIQVLLLAAYELIWFSLPFICVILFYPLYKLIFKQNMFNGYGEWFSHNRWSMLVIVSLYMAPVSLLSRVKLGGDTNSQSVTVYFLLSAVVAIIIEASLDKPSNYLQSSNQVKVTKLSVLSVATVLTIMLIVYIPNKIPDLKSFYDNPPEIAYRYAKNHLEQIYFPQMPLSTLMAEGKLYHSFNGLWDREKARFKLRKEHFQEFIPSQLKFVAFYNQEEMELMINYLPKFSVETKLNDLPKWLIFMETK